MASKSMREGKNSGRGPPGGMEGMPNMEMMMGMMGALGGNGGNPLDMWVNVL